MGWRISILEITAERAARLQLAVKSFYAREQGYPANSARIDSPGFAVGPRTGYPARRGLVIPGWWGLLPPGRLLSRFLQLAPLGEDLYSGGDAA